MDFALTINHATCIKCGKCVRICPSRIFTQATPGGEIGLSHPETCITCGHCAAICPTGSVEHSAFPAGKVHPIDRAQLPTPEQVMLLCRARRSNRAFSDKPVPTEMLEQILEAAHRAPTASNKQEVSFTLVTDPEKLKQISDFTVGVFTSVFKKLENPLLRPILKKIMPDVYRYVPTFRRLMREHAAGNDLILRKATAVIFIHTPKGNRSGQTDSNLAYQNGSLMAESLGASQFYTGFVCNALHQDNSRKVEKLFGIEGTIHAGMALGMPAFCFSNYIDKKEIDIQRL